MQITYLGHAGWLVETDDCVVLMDPWLSRTGAYLQSWWQLPANDHMAAVVTDLIQDTNKPIVAYVSHEHRDHFDEQFLVTLPSTVSYVVAYYSQPDFVTRLRAVTGSPTITLTDGEGISIGATRLTLFVVDDGMERDSAIRVDHGSGSFLNLNDAKLFDRLDEIAGSGLDVFTCQFSGAIWHPVCYDYDMESMRSIGDAKTASKWRLVEHALHTVKPRLYVPSAGPPAFLDPVLRHLNEDPWRAVFPRAPAFVNHLATELPDCAVEALLPGDRLAVSPDGVSVTHVCEPMDDAAYDAEIEHQAKRHADQFGDRPLPSFEPVLEGVERLLSDKLAYLTAPPASLPGRPLYIGATSHPHLVLRVDLRGRTVGRHRGAVEREHYLILAPDWALDRLVKGHVSWDELMLSMRIAMSRVPDRYDVAAHGFLVHEPADMAQFSDELAASVSDQRINVTAAGVRYTIDRYCPHMGGDLVNTCVEDGRFLICPRHGWRFDLYRGGAAVSNPGSINARPVTDRPA